MKRVLLTWVCACFALTLVAKPALAQPKPGPEHEMLKKFEGDWDATVSMMGTESKATAKYKVGMGGFWLTLDFKGDFGGMPFEGKGLTGYDPRKKKYVSTWADSMEPWLMVMEGEFSNDGKTYTEAGEGPGQDGKLQKMKSVCDFKDKDTIVFTMYQVEAGKDQEMMKITYKRKK